MWYFYAVSSLIASIVCIFLGFLVYFKNKNNILNVRFGLVSILIGLWCLFPFLTDMARDNDTALFHARLVYIAAIFAPATFFHFVFTILNIHERKREKILINTFYLASLLFFTILFSPLFIKEIVRRAPNSFVVAGPLYPLFILFFAALCPYSIYQLYVVYQNSAGYKREQLKFLSLGFCIALVGGGIHLIAPYFDAELFPHDLLLLVWSGIISYAIIRHHFLDIRIAITRAGITLIVYSFVLGVPFWYGYKTGYWIWATALMAPLASLGPFFYNVLQRKAENILLAQQRHYQSILLQASSGMVREHDLNRLLKLIVYVIRRAVKLKFAAAFLDDKEEKAYVLKVMRDGGKEYPELSFTYDHPFIEYIKRRKEPFTYDELPQEIKNTVQVDLAFSLIVPSFIESRLLGFLALGNKLNNTLYTQDDINIFVTLSNQAALAIENCIFLQEFKKTQDRVYNAEKLAAIGGMADGLAHQMKNRLNVFALASQEQTLEVDDFVEGHKELLESNEDLKKALGYFREIGQTMYKNVKQANGILQGILGFARTEANEDYFNEFPLKDVVEQAVVFLKIKHSMSESPVTIDIDPAEMVTGVKGQIQECLFNIMDNGYEAIREKVEYHLSDREREQFKSLITIKATQKERTSLIEIRDNGMGIKEENRVKIFSAFFTTKSSTISGSGIGMYVVKRMIEENHKGKIWFESEYGKGTKFCVELPRNPAVNIAADR